jgi:hypothetical protein
VKKKTRAKKLIRKVNMVEKYKESQHGNKSCYVKKWCQNIGGTWQVNKDGQCDWNVINFPKLIIMEKTNVIKQENQNDNTKDIIT